MVRIKPQEGTVSIPVDIREGGGVVDGQLLSCYQCPKCGETLRFIAVFDSVAVAERVVTLAKQQMRGMELARTGRAIVGTATGMSMYGPRSHGRSRYAYGGYYGGGCPMLPYYASERDLAREIWVKLHRYGDDVEPMPPVRIDLTRLDSVQRACDVVNPGDPPLLLYDNRLLSSPDEVVVGRWDPKEPWELHRERLKQAPKMFLQMVALMGRSI